MSKIVIGVFDDHGAAEEAVSELKIAGMEQDVSLVAREESDNNEATLENQNLMEGTVTGGVLGGVAGWLAGAGALLIPGVGPVVAAGPFAATLTGLAAGGLAGGLVDYGIPEERSEYYEEQVRSGKMLVTLETDEDRSVDAMAIMENNGALDIEIHS